MPIVQRGDAVKVEGKMARDAFRFELSCKAMKKQEVKTNQTQVNGEHFLNTHAENAGVGPPRRELENT